jgi:hypothetical protein
MSGSEQERKAMLPIYFPFTVVSGEVISRVGSLFEKAVLYMPSKTGAPPAMQELQQQGILDIRTPDTGDDADFMELMDQYRSWADLHKKTGLSMFRGLKPAIPFYDEDRVAGIQSRILKNLSGEGSEEEIEEDPYLTARVFLQMAQEYDIQNMELKKSLYSVESMETDLYRHLSGPEEPEEDDHPGLGGSSLLLKGNDDPGAYMTAERLEAWSTLALSDPPDSSFFFTDSENVMDYIRELHPEMEPVGKEDVDYTAGIDLYRLLDLPPKLFLAGFIKEKKRPRINGAEKTGKYTLIGSLR